jgi:hypothetical protein
MSTKLETVARFHDLTQAQAARAALEAEGISCELRDESTGSIDWGLMPALGGLRLQVAAADVARAEETLGELHSGPTAAEVLTAGGAEAPSVGEEAEYREASRRRKRLVGLISFLIMFLPILLTLILGWID